MYNFNCQNGYNLVTLANIIAIYISSGLTPDEINILGCLFNCIGNNLALIASTCEDEE